MNCERCAAEHSGGYGSGRFCSSYCARSYSTSDARLSINERVRAKLAGRKRPLHPNAHVWDDRDREKAMSARKENQEKRILGAPWNTLSAPRRRLRLLLEQAGLCAICAIPQEWNGLPLRFHFDHIKGKRAGEERENVRMICPNCHSQTPTYGSKSISEESRERLRELGRVQAKKFPNNRRVSGETVDKEQVPSGVGVQLPSDAPIPLAQVA